MSPRKTTEAERNLFREVIDEARPLAPAAPSRQLSAEKKARQSGASGLDGRTEERLRRGAIKPDAKLDLHGLTEQAAHQVLLNFLRTAQARRFKRVLIVTGKGARVAADAPFDMELNYRSRGILKAVVPRWLREAAFAGIVAGTQAAHIRHGGDGALYVYLRKPG
jgi:DNA-nicking Smr family endonuclease